MTTISKRALFNKGALSAGLGIGALALLGQQRATADTPFSSFAFPAAGGSTARTMPERLSETRNVRDFGAVGDGIADDTAAIQRTVDWTSNAHRGVIFFPPGTYKVSAPITFNYNGELSIIFQGVGNASQIAGNVSGYIFDRANGNPTSGVRVFRDLALSNSHAAGGGIRMMGTVGGSIENCHINAYRGLALLSGNSWQVFNTKLTGSVTPGSVGILASNGVSIVNCDIQAFEHGIRHHNVGLQVIGGRIEVCTAGIMLGQDENGGVFQSTAAMIAGTSMEANQTGILFKAASSGQISAVSMGGGVPMVCGLDFSGGYNLMLSGVAVSGPYSRAAIDARNAGGVTFISCVVNNTISGGTQWLLPSTASQIARIMC